ncbi:MAG: leucine-rich repeat protein, partial [Acutalibacteraceae bacterium]|nr:leucine-rich repeat protein [Acutalibacteraceae bacterium]
PSEIEDKQVMEIGEYVFADNSNLTKLIIPKGIEKIRDYAFMNCTNLGMVYYTGSREDWYNVKIDSGNEALKSKEVYCDALVKNDESGVWVAQQMFDDTCIITDYFGNANKVQIPSEIADRSVMEIGEYLFAGNNNLTTVIIPESIKHIREGVFMNCDKLSDVYYTGNESQWCNVSVNHDNHSLINATIHYNYTESVKGDVNGDNRLAVDDVIYVLKGIVGDMELTAEQIENADLSGDGQLTVVDAVLLQRAILEL